MTKMDFTLTKRNITTNFWMGKCHKVKTWFNKWRMLICKIRIVQGEIGKHMGVSNILRVSFQNGSCSGTKCFSFLLFLYAFVVLCVYKQKINLSLAQLSLKDAYPIFIGCQSILSGGKCMECANKEELHNNLSYDVFFN